MGDFEELTNIRLMDDKKRALKFLKISGVRTGYFNQNDEKKGLLLFIYLGMDSSPGPKKTWLFLGML
jgi:hypothetical protein